MAQPIVWITQGLRALNDERGQNLVEFAMVAVFVAGMLVAGVGFADSDAMGLWHRLRDVMRDAIR
jgi:Flp pilus assembly pilin Flp